MFSDPQSVTIGTVTTSLPRIQDDGLASLYSSPNGLIRLRISHQVNNKTGQIQHLFRLEQDVVATDPFAATGAPQVKKTLSMWFVIDQPPFGFSATDYTNMSAAIQSMLTGGVIAKLIGQEH
ncbi:TPA_asm: coat protein [ssRNA phage Gephyllon.2_4]|uniref:Coat protein n=2 Tax=Leviviricetes TaxID=2842243 RepID=A0A8S5L225_9VIRU|nr:coat protein [ssRNA phage Gephyllon.2_4]QDH88039.1 MAG: hypothetical protein H2BulkLitter11229_000003 [Leviviridae sp.]DAD51539.1 TPA_asm: coat protein [ssRNA phage Gephyllon.2_4]